MRVERAATGWLFSLVGGALIAVLGFLYASGGFNLLFSAVAGSVAADAAARMVTQGMIVTAAGLLVLFGSAAFYAMPDQRRNWAALVIALSLLGWIELGALAGGALEDLGLAISIGPILGLLGGILGLLWNPADEPTAAN